MRFARQGVHFEIRCSITVRGLTSASPNPTRGLRDLHNELVRVQDLLILKKDSDGSLVAYELSDLEAGGIGERRSDGAVLALLLSAAVAATVEPSGTTSMVVWENTWAPKRSLRCIGRRRSWSRSQPSSTAEATDVTAVAVRAPTTVNCLPRRAQHLMTAPRMHQAGRALARRRRPRTRHAQLSALVQPQRLHSRLQNVPPIEYETEYYRQIDARQQPLPENSASTDPGMH
jgi:hypothetical protein